MKKQDKNTKQKSQNTHIKQEILSIAVIFIGIMIGVSLYTNQSGVFNVFLHDSLRNLFGNGAYIIPLVIIMYGIYIFKRKNQDINKRELPIILAIICLYSSFFYVQEISKLETKAQENSGIIGTFIGSNLMLVFDTYGSYICIVFLITVLTIILTKKSIMTFLSNIMKYIVNLITNMKNKYIENRKVRQNEIKLMKENKQKQKLEQKREKIKEPTQQNIKKSMKEDSENKKTDNSQEENKQEERKIEIIHFAKNQNVNEEATRPIEMKQKVKEIKQTQEEGVSIEDQLAKGNIEQKQIQYIYPNMGMLDKNTNLSSMDKEEEFLNNAKKLEETLSHFGVEAKVLQISKGPTVTRYELQPSQGVKVSKIVNLSDDIALHLAATGVRIEAPIPGKAAIGIEIPNSETETVYLREVLESDNFKKFPSKTAVALGKDISGDCVITDLAKMPHLLIAGSTGSGKSVCINTIIMSILYKANPDEVKLLLVDPKVVELSVYNGIPHLLIPVVTDPKKANAALCWAVGEMLKRYQSFAENNVRDIKGYNKLKEEKNETDKMPQIIIVVDELADLMMAAGKEVEDSICRLAQMARAAGIHLIIATQRPSVDVITGVIKANIPSRLAFAVSSGIDSRTILDMNGAEKLLGKGDMLFYPVGANKPHRIQGAFVSDKEVQEVVSFIKSTKKAEYDEKIIEEVTTVKVVDSTDDSEDEYYNQAVQLVMEKEKASISMLQRAFRIGYNRAARLMDELEANGVVGQDEGSKPRRVLK